MLALATTAVRDKLAAAPRLDDGGLFGTAVFSMATAYHAGDSRAVCRRRPGGRRPAPARLGHSVDAAGADRPVCGAALRHRRHRQTVRADHAGVVVALVALGLPHIAEQPGVLVALTGLRDRVLHAPAAGGVHRARAVVLVVTGGEALYADLGHFGKLPIRIAWYALVMPALVINYFGQGAMLLGDPAAVSNPFYLMAPEWARLPLVFLATAATVIASQA